MTRELHAVDPIRGDRLKWALLGSGYVHVGIVLFLVGRALFFPGDEAALDSADTGRMVVHLLAADAAPAQLPGQVELTPPPPHLLDRVVRNDPGEKPRGDAFHSSVDHRGDRERSQRPGPQYLGEGGGESGGGRPRRAAGGRVGGGSSAVDGVGGRHGAPLAPDGTRAATGGEGGWLQGRAGASGDPGRRYAVQSHQDLEVDPIPELQDALGIASFDRSKRPATHRRPTTGPEVAPGGTSYQRVASRKTPLGTYVNTVEDLIHQRWTAQELPIEARARGIQGTVSITYRIDRRGFIRQPRIVRSSGNPTLDRMALGSLPDRFPPLPRELEREHLDHKVNLTYRNPLIAMGNR